MARDERRRQKKLAKKAAKRKTPRVGRQLESMARGLQATRIISYEITDEPMPDPAYERLPKPVKDQLDTLYHDVLFQRPKEAIAILQPLIEQYPDVPQLYNYLHIAYQKIRDRTHAQCVLQETLKRFPDYLFGRIAYANHCLLWCEAEKVPEIFEGQYELKLLYPERERFHLSEVLGFYAVIAWYFHTQGERHRVETYYELMRQLDPKHYSTRFIQRLLHPSWFRRLLRRLLSKKE